jgi:hypothetical protein
MAIIALKAWYLEQYEPIHQIVQRPHDLRLSQNSLLKAGLRADFLDDRAVFVVLPKGADIVDVVVGKPGPTNDLKIW